MKVVFSKQEALDILARHASEKFQQSFSPSDVELQGDDASPRRGRPAKAAANGRRRAKAANGRRKARNGRRKAANGRRKAGNGRRRRSTAAAATGAAGSTTTPGRRGRPPGSKSRRGRRATPAATES